MKTKIYIAGKITGDPNYQAKFDAAAEEYAAEGYIVLNLAGLPQGMQAADYMRICFAMIDTADLVVFLPGYETSPGAQLEMQYCLYIAKRVKRPGDKQAALIHAGNDSVVRDQCSSAFGRRAMSGADRCVMCGAPIPEGRQVCPLCAGGGKNHTEKDEHGGRWNMRVKLPGRYQLSDGKKEAFAAAVREEAARLVGLRANMTLDLVVMVSLLVLVEDFGWGTQARDGGRIGRYLGRLSELVGEYSDDYDECILEALREHLRRAGVEYVGIGG